MRITSQRRLAAQVLKASGKRVWFDQESLLEVKEAITKADIKNLIGRGIIGVTPKKGISRARARKRKEQKKKGRLKGTGTRKGKKTARLPRKDKWMGKIRAQRKFLKELKEKKLITTKIFADLYKKSKGNFFRNVRHIKVYIDDHKLVKKK